MLRKIMQTALALTVVLGIAVSASEPAEARRGRVAAGIAVGTLLGLGIAGAYGSALLLRRRARVLPRPAPMQLDWPQLLDQPLRRVRLPRWPVSLLAPDHLRLIRSVQS